jgi:SnoaL-like domain
MPSAAMGRAASCPRSGSRAARALRVLLRGLRTGSGFCALHGKRYSVARYCVGDVAGERRDCSPPVADLETENLETSVHLLDEGVEIWNAPEFPVTGPYRGHDGVRQWAAEQWEVFSGLHHEIEEIIEAPDGETLVSVQRTQGRMTHTDMNAGFISSADVEYVGQGSCC